MFRSSRDWSCSFTVTFWGKVDFLIRNTHLYLRLYGTQKNITVIFATPNLITLSNQSLSLSLSLSLKQEGQGHFTERPQRLKLEIQIQTLNFFTKILFPYRLAHVYKIA